MRLKWNKVMRRETAINTTRKTGNKFTSNPFQKIVCVFILLGSFLKKSPIKKIISVMLIVISKNLLLLFKEEK
jgi:hypothetical protein